MKRTLTPEQIARRDERRAKFKVLWKQVADMPELERVQLANRTGLLTCDGHSLSPRNQCLIILQAPKASVVGGFRQWLKHGRAVRKGEHGAMIWVPTGGRKSTGPQGETVLEEGTETRFTIGTVFDIGQTDAVGTAHPAHTRGNPELQPALMEETL